MLCSAIKRNIFVRESDRMRTETATDSDFCGKTRTADESIHIFRFLGVFRTDLRFAVSSQPSRNENMPYDQVHMLLNFLQAEFGVQLAINVCYIVSMISFLWMYYWHANEIMLWVRHILVGVMESNLFLIHIIIIYVSEIIVKQFIHRRIVQNEQCDKKWIYNCVHCLQSDTLSGSMYNCDWYGGDKSKFTKALRIFMANTQQPIRMRTLFLEMNLSCFLRVSSTNIEWMY